MLRVGLIGYGAIGRALAAALRDGQAGDARLTAALARRPRADEAVTADAEAFFATEHDAVVECAGHEAVRAHGERALQGGADLLVTSVGALMDDALRERLLSAARASGRRLILPSAGIGALDILAGAAVGGLTRVAITVRKDPSAWTGTPAEGLCDLANLREPFLLFDGPVREGAPLYPGNVNISAAVALAGLGPDRTQLRIYADPKIATHVVEVEAEGAFGRFRFVEDVALSENRKTGRIVAMALVKTLRQMSGPLVVGG